MEESPAATPGEVCR